MDEEIRSAYTISLPCTIDVRDKYGIEIISYIDGSCYIPKDTISKDILSGSLYLKYTSNMDYHLPCKITINQMNFSKDILEGNLKLDTFLAKNTILEGKLTYEKDDFSVDLFEGSLSYIFSKTIDLLDGSIDYEKDKIETDIDGSLEYEVGELKKTLFEGYATIEEEDGSVDLFNGSLEYNKEGVDITILEGKINIPKFYSAIDMACRIKVNKLRLCHCIRSMIKVPPSRNIDIPCTIEVDGHNYLGQTVMNGTLSILKEDHSCDLLDGKVVLLPTMHVDIDGRANIEAVYTRREFGANIDVVHGFEQDILPSTITVKPPATYWFWSEILASRITVGNLKIKEILSTIEVKGERKEEKQYFTPRKLPKARVAIVVSPTWRYEPFVFKGCLITFLDRYYRKLDLDMVFGGNPRSDFDIINLALNYRIDENKLLRVPIEYDPKNIGITMNSVKHFIAHMTSGTEYPLSRVFVFMNKPSWYYDDPIGMIPLYCKNNNISCVCIDSGGEYVEMLELDQARDEMLIAKERDRFNRMHPNYGYINLRLPGGDPSDITY